jgi:hypothetical protein
MGCMDVSLGFCSRQLPLAALCRAGRGDDVVPPHESRDARLQVLPPLLTELRTPAVHALALPLVLSIAAKQAPDQFLTVTLPELQPLLSTVDGDALVMLLGHLPTMAALMPPASADSVVRVCVLVCVCVHNCTPAPPSRR